MTQAEIEEYFLAKPLHEEAKEYVTTHSKRFSYLLKMVKGMREEMGPDPIHIMDVGPSFFTHLMQISFPNDTIHTLGFTHPSSRGGHLPDFIDIPEETFVQFDLNNSQYPEKWAKPPKCDLIIMGEVLEHLYTSPTLVLKFLRSFAAPGARCVIGTPNAVTLVRRLSLLFGKNPYENIRETRDNPGHFREYTVAELKEMGEKAGWKVHDLEIKNYFKAFSLKGRAFDSFVKYCLPSSFNTGINIVYKNLD